MSAFFSVTRRQMLAASAAGLASSVVGAGQSSAADAAATVGFVYVGPRDDYGYNQSHAEGAAALKKIPGIKVVEQENVPETVDVAKTMEAMINLEGASLLFPTSFGYFNPFMLDAAKKYPSVQFRHCGGLWTDKDPKNAGSYFGYIGVCQYLNGVVAGHMTKSKKLAFVAAKPIPQVLLNVNSFLLGARTVDPSITCSVIFTGEWSLAVKEAEATNALLDQGADVVTCHVDSPKVVVQTAAGRGAYVCGYHANQAPLAGDKYLTGAEWNWATVYEMFAKKFLAKEPLPNFVRGGLAEGFVKMSPLGPAVSDAARADFKLKYAEVSKPDFAIVKGPLKDNKGAVVVAAGKAYGERAIELESMNYLVDGVVGSTS
ncbi:MAG: BMP family ABC transporter substrate-binding protein [Hyphomicrobiales bacterium]|nr:BMP family ABC transporter substrate-binding protein [Hyphomicrobiales bacterium]MDE2017263.1 BMP family ABC transporter substrate-binding protein [Hyphomicrobiales bacterium]